MRREALMSLVPKEKKRPTVNEPNQHNQFQRNHHPGSFNHSSPMSDQTPPYMTGNGISPMGYGPNQRPYPSPLRQPMYNPMYQQPMHRPAFIPHRPPFVSRPMMPAIQPHLNPNFISHHQSPPAFIPGHDMPPMHVPSIPMDVDGDMPSMPERNGNSFEPTPPLRLSPRSARFVNQINTQLLHIAQLIVTFLLDLLKKTIKRCNGHGDDHSHLVGLDLDPREGLEVAHLTMQRIELHTLHGRELAPSRLKKLTQISSTERVDRLEIEDRNLRRNVYHPSLATDDHVQSSMVTTETDFLDQTTDVIWIGRTIKVKRREMTRIVNLMLKTRSIQLRHQSRSYQEQQVLRKRNVKRLNKKLRMNC